MHHQNFILREPLLDASQRVIAYELLWQQDGQQVQEADLEQLVDFVASQFQHAEHGWLLGDKQLFLDAVPGMLSTDALHALPPQHTVLSLQAQHLVDPAIRGAVQALRAGGVGISLRGLALAHIRPSLAAYASHVEMRFAGIDIAQQARAYAAARQSTLRIVGRPVSNWIDYDACAALGLDAFIGKLHLTPRPGNPTKGLNPTQTTILQLMQMVQNNVDIRQLEEVLKRDPALSYKLLRNINAVGFGAGRDVQSIRQTIGLMGYAPLYRWLTLLLASASTRGYSPVLLETAVVRGRLTELLGLTHLSKTDGEHLFVAGMFSLLDRLLGVPMQEVLETIPLPAEVERALLARDGPYGRYLALAEACELHSSLVGALANSLELSPLQVNQAHLSALAWAQAVSG